MTSETSNFFFSLKECYVSISEFLLKVRQVIAHMKVMG